MNILTFKNIKLNLDEIKCLVDDIEINLTKNEFLLLEFLLKNTNKIFSRQDLINEVWGT